MWRCRLDGVELREHVDAVQPAVDAVRQRDVDQAVLSGHRHGRLGAVLGQRVQTRALTPAKYQGDDVFHSLSLADFLCRERDRDRQTIHCSGIRPGGKRWKEGRHVLPVRSKCRRWSAYYRKDRNSALTLDGKTFRLGEL